MKKILSIALVGVLCMAFSACEQSDGRTQYEMRIDPKTEGYICDLEDDYFDLEDDITTVRLFIWGEEDITDYDAEDALDRIVDYIEKAHYAAYDIMDSWEEITNN